MIISHSIGMWKLAVCALFASLAVAIVQDTSLGKPPAPRPLTLKAIPGGGMTTSGVSATLIVSVPGDTQNLNFPLDGEIAAGSGIAQWLDGPGDIAMVVTSMFGIMPELNVDLSSASNTAVQACQVVRDSLQAIATPYSYGRVGSHSIIEITDPLNLPPIGSVPQPGTLSGVLSVSSATVNETMLKSPQTALGASVGDSSVVARLNGMAGWTVTIKRATSTALNPGLPIEETVEFHPISFATAVSFSQYVGVGDTIEASSAASGLVFAPANDSGDWSATASCTYSAAGISQ